MCPCVGEPEGTGEEVSEDVGNMVRFQAAVLKQAITEALASQLVVAASVARPIITDRLLRIVFIPVICHER